MSTLGPLPALESRRGSSEVPSSKRSACGGGENNGYRSLRESFAGAEQPRRLLRRSLIAGASPSGYEPAAQELLLIITVNCPVFSFCQSLVLRMASPSDADTGGPPSSVEDGGADCVIRSAFGRFCEEVRDSGLVGYEHNEELASGASTLLPSLLYKRLSEWNAKLKAFEGMRSEVEALQHRLSAMRTMYLKELSAKDMKIRELQSDGPKQPGRQQSFLAAKAECGTQTDMSGDMSLAMSLWENAVDLGSRLERAEKINNKLLFEDKHRGENWRGAFDEAFIHLSKAQHVLFSYARRCKEQEREKRAQLDTMTSIATDREIALLELSEAANAVISTVDGRQCGESKEPWVLIRDAEESIQIALQQGLGPARFERLSSGEDENEDKLAVVADCLQQAVAIVSDALLKMGRDPEGASDRRSSKFGVQEVHDRPLSGSPGSKSQRRASIGMNRARQLCDKLRAIAKVTGSMKAKLVGAEHTLERQRQELESQRRLLMERRSNSRPPSKSPTASRAPSRKLTASPETDAVIDQSDRTPMVLQQAAERQSRLLLCAAGPDDTPRSRSKATVRSASRCTPPGDDHQYGIAEDSKTSTQQSEECIIDGSVSSRRPTAMSDDIPAGRSRSGTPPRPTSARMSNPRSRPPSRPRSPISAKAGSSCARPLSPRLSRPGQPRSRPMSPRLPRARQPSPRPVSPMPSRAGAPSLRPVSPLPSRAGQPPSRPVSPQLPKAGRLSSRPEPIQVEPVAVEPPSLSTPQSVVDYLQLGMGTATPRRAGQSFAEEAVRPAKAQTRDVGTMTSKLLLVRSLLLSSPAVEWHHLPLGAEMGFGWGLIPVLKDGYSSSSDEDSEESSLDEQVENAAKVDAFADVHPTIARPRQPRPVPPGILAYNAPAEPVLASRPRSVRTRAMHYISPLAWPRVRGPLPQRQSSQSKLDSLQEVSARGVQFAPASMQNEVDYLFSTGEAADVSDDEWKRRQSVGEAAPCQSAAQATAGSSVVAEAANLRSRPPLGFRSHPEKIATSFLQEPESSNARFFRGPTPESKFQSVDHFHAEVAISESSVRSSMGTEDQEAGDDRGVGAVMEFNICVSNWDAQEVDAASIVQSCAVSIADQGPACAEPTDKLDKSSITREKENVRTEREEEQLVAAANVGSERAIERNVSGGSGRSSQSEPLRKIRLVRGGMTVLSRRRKERAPDRQSHHRARHQSSSPAKSQTRDHGA